MRFYFNGCSITQGAGFANEKLNPNIYPNLIATDYINDASGGASNLKIFLHSSRAPRWLCEPFLLMITKQY